jgi:hypothetical protein
MWRSLDLAPQRNRDLLLSPSRRALICLADSTVLTAIKEYDLSMWAYWTSYAQGYQGQAQSEVRLMGVLEPLRKQISGLFSLTRYASYGATAW